MGVRWPSAQISNDSAGTNQRCALVAVGARFTEREGGFVDVPGKAFLTGCSPSDPDACVAAAGPRSRLARIAAINRRIQFSAA
jgi:hypothetical protein